MYRSRPARYLVVGGLSFLLDVGLLFVFRDVVGAPLWLATATAFLGSVAVNYLLQKTFSFGSAVPHGRAALLYAALLALNTLVTVGVVQLATVLGYGWLVGKVAATGLTTTWNYFAFRYVVFPSARVTSGRPSVRP